MIAEVLRVAAPLVLVLATVAWTWRSTHALPRGPAGPGVPRGAWIVALPLLVVAGVAAATGVVSSDELTELRGSTDWLTWWTADLGMPSRLHRLVRSLVGGDQAVAPTRALHAVLALVAAAAVARTAHDASGGRSWRWIALLVVVGYGTASPFGMARARALAVVAQLVAIGGFQDVLAGRTRTGVRALALGLLAGAVDDPTSAAGLVPAAAWLAWRDPTLRVPLGGAVGLAAAAAAWPAVEALLYHGEAPDSPLASPLRPIAWGLSYVAVLAALGVAGRRARVRTPPGVEAHALASGAGILALVAATALGVLPPEVKSISALEPWATLAVGLLVVHVLRGWTGAVVRGALVLALLVPSAVQLVGWPVWVRNGARTLDASRPEGLPPAGAILVGPGFHAATWSSALGVAPTSPAITDWALGPYQPLGAGPRRPCDGLTWGLVWLREPANPEPPVPEDPTCRCTADAEAGPWVRLRCVATPP